MRRATLVGFLVVAVSLIGAAGAQAKLDPTFGQEGMAPLSPPVLQ